jgi:hypothetical protein
MLLNFRLSVGELINVPHRLGGPDGIPQNSESYAGTNAVIVQRLTWGSRFSVRDAPLAAHFERNGKIQLSLYWEADFGIVILERSWVGSFGEVPV